MSWINKLLGEKPKAKPASRKAAPITVKDNPRSKAIAQAREIHRTAGAKVRAQIAASIAELQRAGPKMLRDPAAVERLMGLIQAQRALGSLMGHDLKRYLVLTGLRQWLGEGEAPPAAKPKTRVVRR